MNDKKVRQLRQLVSQLAKSYSLDSDSAKAYLLGVQSQFVLHKPSFKVIMGILAEEKPDALPSTFRMAALIRKKRDKSSATQNGLKISEDKSNPSLQSPKRDRYDLLGGPYAVPDEHQGRDHDKPKLVRRTKSDYERVSPNNLRHCPHGVPTGKVCAICEPDKFRDVTGED